MSDIKERLSKVAEQAKQASSAIGEKMAQAGKVAAESAKTLTVTLLDHDGDGKVGQNDVKIMADKGTVLVKKATKEARELVSEAAKTDLGKDATAGAIIGAVVAVPVPVIGPIAGAAIGAGIGVYSNLTNKKISGGNGAGTVSKVKTTTKKKPEVAIPKKSTVAKQNNKEAKPKRASRKPKNED